MVTVFFLYPSEMLPGAEGCIRVRRKLCSVKSGRSVLTKSELSMGPWKETRSDFTRKAQCSDVMSL